MSFLESPRFPERISFGVAGGPGFSTEVVVVRAGYESRNANWQQARARYSLDHGGKSASETEELIAFFRMVRGRAHGFRFKDWTDFAVTTAAGGLQALSSSTGTALGSFAAGYGMPSHQLRRSYGTGALIQYRDIRKPIAAGVTVYANGTALSTGTAAGNYALDAASGVVTFVAAATAAVSSVTTGSTTTVVLSSGIGLTTAGRLYLAGLAGAGSTGLNGLSHAITSVSGGTHVLNTNTVGLTITTGSGIGYRYPQAADALTWSGEFDVPVRFESDECQIAIEESAPAGRVYSWSGINLIELRV